MGVFRKRQPKRRKVAAGGDKAAAAARYWQQHANQESNAKAAGPAELEKAAKECREPLNNQRKKLIIKIKRPRQMDGARINGDERKGDAVDGSTIMQNQPLTSRCMASTSSSSFSASISPLLPVKTSQTSLNLTMKNRSNSACPVVLDVADNAANLSNLFDWEFLNNLNSSDGGLHMDTEDFENQSAIFGEYLNPCVEAKEQKDDRNESKMSLQPHQQLQQVQQADGEDEPQQQRQIVGDQTALIVNLIDELKGEWEQRQQLNAMAAPSKHGYESRDDNGGEENGCEEKMRRLEMLEKEAHVENVQKKLEEKQGLHLREWLKPDVGLLLHNVSLLRIANNHLVTKGGWSIHKDFYRVHVRAHKPFPVESAHPDEKFIYFFEATFSERCGKYSRLVIGLMSGPNYPLKPASTFVGNFAGSFAIDNDGDYWASGKIVTGHGKGGFSSGDVVGCGISVASFQRQIFFTKNGEFWGNPIQLEPKDVKANLYPTVTAYAFDSSDCVNFDVGADLITKPFKYEFWKMKKKHD